MKHGRFNKIKEAFYKKFNPGGYLRTVNEAYNQDLRSSDQKIADSLNYRFDHALSSAYSVNLPKNPSEIADYIEDNKEAIRAERESQLFNEQNSDKINRAMEIRHKLIEDGLLPENPLPKDINKK